MIPRRKYEPLFSGTIEIVEGDWRIHSLDLMLLKTSQLQILDTVEIRQIHAPVVSDSSNAGGTSPIWQVKDQVVNFTFNILGFDAVGTFLDVYNDYDLNPRFRKRFFNNVFIRYDTAGNRRTRAYWDSIRPIPLEPDEKVNYTVKDSIYRIQPGLDGDEKEPGLAAEGAGAGDVESTDVFGVRRSDFRQPRPLTYTIDPLFTGLSYNTVEGFNMKLNGDVEPAAAERQGDADLFAAHPIWLSQYASQSLGRAEVAAADL